MIIIKILINCKILSVETSKRIHAQTQAPAHMSIYMSLCALLCVQVYVCVYDVCVCDVCVCVCVHAHTRLFTN